MITCGAIARWEDLMFSACAWLGNRNASLRSIAVSAAVPSCETLQLMSEHIRSAAGSRPFAWTPACASLRQLLVEASVRPAESSTPSAISPASLSICDPVRSEEHTSELQSLRHLVCRLL